MPAEEMVADQIQQVAQAVKSGLEQAPANNGAPGDSNPSSYGGSKNGAEHRVKNVHDDDAERYGPMTAGQFGGDAVLCSQAPCLVRLKYQQKCEHRKDQPTDRTADIRTEKRSGRSRQKHEANPGRDAREKTLHRTDRFNRVAFRTSDRACQRRPFWIADFDVAGWTNPHARESYHEMPIWSILGLSVGYWTPEQTAL
jgi:hypothetical protein